MKTGQSRQLLERKIDNARGHLWCTCDGDLRGLAAAQLDHHASRKLEARQHESGIDPALEAIARVRLDAELATSLRDVRRGPQCGLDQHVRRRLRTARGLPAHDAG